MSVLTLAFLGGIFSFVSTGLGSITAPMFTKFEKLRRYHLSMDFALGVMLSAVAFSLVGPELISGNNLNLVLAGLLVGIGFIVAVHQVISYFNRDEKYNSSKILLIAALIFHNLPEGMGAGASMAGMELSQAIPLQIGLSIQNIAEGLLLTLLLKSMGLSLRMAVLGGIISGGMEMMGAIGSGLLLQSTKTLLPFLLSLAGGAMMMSVVLELIEGLTLGRMFQRQDFIYGLITIPVTNFLLGWI